MLNPSHSAGGTGQLFPDATLSLADGGSLSIDTFRPRYDLVILMLGAGAIVPAAARLLDELARDRSAIEAEDGQVLVVVAADPGRVASDWPWPFPPLLDTDGRLHARVGAMDAQGSPRHRSMSPTVTARSTRPCGRSSPVGPRRPTTSSSG